MANILKFWGFLRFIQVFLAFGPSWNTFLGVCPLPPEIFLTLQISCQKYSNKLFSNFGRFRGFVFTTVIFLIQHTSSIKNFKCYHNINPQVIQILKISVLWNFTKRVTARDDISKKTNSHFMWLWLTFLNSELWKTHFHRKTVPSLKIHSCYFFCNFHTSPWSLTLKKRRSVKSHKKRSVSVNLEVFRVQRAM